MSTLPRVVILGAGFGGLELATRLSDAFGDDIDVTLIDKGEGFVFGFAKLDIMFGRATLDEVVLPYEKFDKPGVRFRHEVVTRIDAEARVVTTDGGTYEADYLVIALGADYDVQATPGLAELGTEFYSVAGAKRVAPIIDSFTAGHVLIGVCGAPYKCPPAPSEAALMLHDHLVRRGARGQCEITLASPLPSPVPPSPETSAALIDEFAARDITFIPGARFVSLDPQRRIALLEDGSELAFDLFLGVPRHRAPDVVIESGLTVDGYVPVDSFQLHTSVPRVWAIGDVATVGAPKAGVFSEGQAAVVADHMIAMLRQDDADSRYDGRGSCYLEFGDGRVARVDVDFLSGPTPTGAFQPPSVELRAEKELFGSSRRERWFDVPVRS
jgi:sulfide:quinone oxidoreductase